MKLLLDTHIFLWYLNGDPQLSTYAIEAISDPDNEVYVSVVSVWEVVIKHSLGKLPLPSPPEDYLPQARERHGFRTLPVEEAAMSYLAALPPLHRDPFDRLLIAQAKQHGLTLVTADSHMRAYPVTFLEID